MSTLHVDPAGPEPLVSVITPCRNAAPFVGAAIRSVLAQTHPRVEHIVVDDASTDASWAEIRRYGEQVRALRLEENRGAAHARNRGAAEAAGEYLLFLDADDALGPDAISGLVAAARARPEVIGICAWKRLRRGHDGWSASPAEVALPHAEQDPLRAWLEGSWVPCCALLWPRELYRRTGGWDEDLSLNDDGDLVLRALGAGARFSIAASGEAYYRAHEGSHLSLSASGVSRAGLQSQRRVLDKLEERLVQGGGVGEYRDLLGRGYRSLARMAFQAGQTELGRAALQRADLWETRPTLVSRTAWGRALERALGLERKEAVVTALARWGVRTRPRARFHRLRSTVAAGSAAPAQRGGHAG